MIFSGIVGSRGSTVKYACCSQRRLCSSSHLRICVNPLFRLSWKNGSFFSASAAFLGLVMIGVTKPEPFGAVAPFVEKLLNLDAVRPFVARKAAAALREKARVLSDRFNAAFWDEESGFYAFALDGAAWNLSGCGLRV